ncbi:MAG: hypothetical protein ACOZFS_10495 [Thermodesulfobacteriota bacterium]
MKRWAMMKVVLGGVVAVMLGCATAERGRKFDTTLADRIEIGKTTEAEVISWLGPPLATKTTSDKQKILGWAYGTASISGFKMQSQGDKLLVTFNDKGIVTAVSRESVPGKAR